MSEENSKSPSPAATPPATSKAVLLLLLLNLGASGFMTFKLVTSTPAEAASAHSAEPTNTTEIVGPIHALAPFVVNLDEPGQSRYVKVTMQLELASSDVIAALTKNEQLIRDAMLSYLSGLKLADTLGTAAKDKLRAAVLERLDNVVGTKKVRRVFFQEFVVQ